MRIVIVDDNPTNVLVLKRLIEQKLSGHETISFTSPVEALTWCEQEESDLILLDYMMPEVNGLTFIQRFRAMRENREVPIIMITADSDKNIRYQALEVGANDFLNKPIDQLELVARVNNSLALRRGQKQLRNRAEWLGNEIKKATATIKAQEREALIMLSKAAEFRDPETGAHIDRMSHYSQLIAANLGMSVKDQEMILDAAPMHDIGKVGTPDAILLKPGKLSVEEFAIMKEHATYGHAILKDSDSPLLQIAANIALCHHEKFNGLGYPRGLKGEGIPLFARIVAVADVFDALTSERPYKSAWEMERAVKLLEDEKGHHFDPQCVEAFLQDRDAILRIKERHQDEPEGAILEHPLCSDDAN